MAIAYCLKCKSNRDITNSCYETAANGVLVVKGECPICRTKIARLLGKPKEEGVRV